MSSIKRKLSKETSFVHFGEICNSFPHLKNVFIQPVWQLMKKSKEVKEEIENFIINSNNNDLNQVLLEVGTPVSTSDNCIDNILQESNDLMEKIKNNWNNADKYNICQLLINLQCSFQKLYMLIGLSIKFFDDRNLLYEWQEVEEFINICCIVMMQIIDEYKEENNIEY